MTDPYASIPHRTGIRWLLAAILLSQPLQYAITARFGEPYPALMMPRFTGTMTNPDGFIWLPGINATVHFDDGRTALISPYWLVEQAPVSQRDTILYENFGPLPDRTETLPASSLIGRWKSILFPGSAIRKAKLGYHVPDPRTRQWIKKRLAALYPSRTATSMTFEWYFKLYDEKAIEAQPVRRPWGVYDVKLDETL